VRLKSLLGEVSLLQRTEEQVATLGWISLIFLDCGFSRQTAIYLPPIADLWCCGHHVGLLTALPPNDAISTLSAVPVITISCFDPHRPSLSNSSLEMPDGILYHARAVSRGMDACSQSA